MVILDLASRDFEIYPPDTELWSLKDTLVQRRPKFILTLSEQGLEKVIPAELVMAEIIKSAAKQSNTQNLLLGDIEPNLSFCTLNSDYSVLELNQLNTDLAVILNPEHYPVGIVDNLKCIDKLANYLVVKNKEIKETLMEYEQIFQNIEEEIFVTDHNGYILRLNPAAERVCQVNYADVVGKHVTELEKEHVFSTSITMQVLMQKKKVNMMQEMKSGKRVLATAIPIFNEEGEITRVISTSKDILEINKLREEIEEKNSEIERKNEELNLLREEMFGQVSFIYQSRAMTHIKETVAKIAPMDLTVLIQGESGVGKEVVTKTIHYLSKRRDEPFIKLNCSLIPENLIESELFGYESGAFTGANKGGKIGKIELANNGTLFLDEIGELPLRVQVKLLDFLQDRQIDRVGGTKKVKINTRVVAATNRDLLQMVHEGHFRKDLYYRLNVVPIVIPPLRERKEDIPALVKYFLDKFNAKYGLNKKLTPEIMQAFYHYEWPGNVRELEHVMERIIVINESETITLDYLQSMLDIKPDQGKVICTDIIPLKLAKKEVEQHLVTTAYEMYKSTYKVAKVLEVDQSTVVKLLKKYK
ncbi:sigma-54 interaction domain-containing protein [Paradesulfitobacterium ferrireducens]|uniref:sigma-54 interaction domain-containing protein n=1 Tax=Paradesulfitobacterium ferrireducens TaxID=2816476 RepID=UPI001A902592|nr:sigma 54-interacting transcriptional regulator [Paradesulfitobacterium ferrireducens]